MRIFVTTCSALLLLGAQARGEVLITADEAAQPPSSDVTDKVDPGIGRTRLGHRIFECVFTIGTRSAQSIMASGHISRTNRPHT